MAEPVKPALLVETGLQLMHLAARMPLRALMDAVFLVASLAVSTYSVYGGADLAEMGVIDKDALTLGLAISCPFVTVLGYFSAAPVVIDAVMMMSAQDIPTTVFQVQAIANLLSIGYAIQIANMAVLGTNLLGMACQIVFLALEHFVRSPVGGGWFFFSVKWSVMLNVGLYASAVVVPLNILAPTMTTLFTLRSMVPLASLGNILRTKNAAPFPMGMTVINVIINAMWALYGLLIQDSVLLLPSILGLGLCNFQVMVILWSRGLLPFDLSFLLLLCREHGRREVTPPAMLKRSPSFDEI